MKNSQHEFFPSKRSMTRTHDGVVLLMSGWLGEGTMKVVLAPALAQEGFDVITVGQSRNLSFWDTGSERAKDVHRAAKEALSATGKSVVHLLCHSKAGQDAVNFMNFYALNRESIGYTIHGFGAMAAIGRNGHQARPADLAREAASTVSSVARNRNREVDIFGRSTLNLLKNPILAVSEGISATRCDTVADIERLRNLGAFTTEIEIYGSHDLVVPKPVDRDVEVYDGRHMTPVYLSDVGVDVALRLVA